MSGQTIFLLIVLSFPIAAAYYLIVCFALLGAVLLKETHKLIRIEQTPAHRMTEAQFAGVCKRSMETIFESNGALVFLYPFLLFVARMSKKR